MFETLSHLALQQYWWAIISFLAAILVFLMFVQGGQSLLYDLARTEIEKTILVNALGRKWEFTFTTLVVFGGAFFASFPLFYSVSFGGAYGLWMAILFCFIIQAVAYEFRSKPNNFLGQKTYEIFLKINGFLGTFLIGTVVGTFFTGGYFYRTEMNFSSWTGNWYGFEAFANFHNIALGISVFALARIQAILYFRKNVNEKNIIERTHSALLINTLIFLPAFLYWLIKLMLIDGFSYDPLTLKVFITANKYFENIIAMPVNSLLLIIGILLVLYGVIRSLIRFSPNAIWFTGTGTVLTVFSLFILAGYNNTCFYPSLGDIQSSLNIRNASSSHYTLAAMSYVSLLVPFVIAYIFIAWRAVSNKKIDKTEIESETHLY